MSACMCVHTTWGSEVAAALLERCGLYSLSNGPTDCQYYTIPSWNAAWAKLMSCSCMCESKKLHHALHSAGTVMSDP